MVQVRVVTLAWVAENVPVTPFAVFAPSIPSATATLAAVSAAIVAATNNSRRIRSLPFVVSAQSITDSGYGIDAGGVKRV